MNDNSRADMLKLGAAAAGGYVLGRTKKGKAGLSLALWAAGGGRYSARNLVRTGVIRLARTPQAKAMLDELRETVVHAGQQAMTTAVEARASAMAEALQRRTDALTAKAMPGPHEEPEQAGEQAPPSAREDEQGGEETGEGERESGAPGEATDQQEGARESGPPKARAPQQRARKQTASTEGVRG